ncbi:hypothetical protein [uncultured Pseudodesulfovibrio sp.]|uniref:hypothetical protein n=1 Tax=uncultured Pseudodesulfovibrio sp. TaxID=2035858 RepID=UPI0029C82916|nr:hypothetical protein [uncultured Pseudodesulfovibrio sp.]
MAEKLNPTPFRKALFRRYLLMLVPAAVIFGGWAAYRQTGMAQPVTTATDIIGPVVFIAGIILAAALPLLYRINFVRNMVGKKNVESGQFLSFQLNLMSIALLAPYTAAAAYIAGVPNFYFSGAFLASLYATYYYFPSEKRVIQEMKLFRVTDDKAA